VEWLGGSHGARLAAGWLERTYSSFRARERGRAVIAEAHVVGLPVVCLARGHLSERDQMEPM
jgi:hypothetical protein